MPLNQQQSGLHYIDLVDLFDRTLKILYKYLDDIYPPIYLGGYSL